jgi:hypothetical protein
MRWDHTRSRKASRADRSTERSRSPRTAAVVQAGPKTGALGGHGHESDCNKDLLPTQAC